MKNEKRQKVTLFALSMRRNVFCDLFVCCCIIDCCMTSRNGKDLYYIHVRISKNHTSSFRRPLGTPSILFYRQDEQFGDTSAPTKAAPPCRRYVIARLYCSY